MTVQSTALSREVEHIRQSVGSGCLRRMSSVCEMRMLNSKCVLEKSPIAQYTRNEEERNLIKDMK